MSSDPFLGSPVKAAIHRNQPAARSDDRLSPPRRCRVPHLARRMSSHPPRRLYRNDSTSLPIPTRCTRTG
jgi:hypothetical protein